MPENNKHSSRPDYDLLIRLSDHLDSLAVELILDRFVDGTDDNGYADYFCCISRDLRKLHKDILDQSPQKEKRE